MTDEATEEQHSDGGRRRYRKALVSGALAVVVLAAAAVGYDQVVPITHVARARLAQLVLTRPGIKEFDAKPVQALELPVARTGLSVLMSAGAKAPDRTGAYLVAWKGAAVSDALESVAFLAPSTDVAKRLVAQVRSTNLSDKAYASNALGRRSTYTVPGVTGSAGSLYVSSATTATPSQLAVTVFRSGDVVSVTEALHPTAAKADTETATIAEYHHLATTAPGFSLEVVRRPLTATLVWVAGALILAALAALSPVIAGRLRTRRQERREAEERARGSTVPGHRITKRQR
ncbi:MAG: hypothetical protein M3063_15350 [Actinomycetota bacterium]|nr:hypothetical protein [Actinomycetota bacterium]MDQ6944885.1 hypothetical protein [Actinomycetota bacterium]